jgi:hypothetical protein
MDHYAETPTGLLFVSDGYSVPMKWDGLSSQMEEIGLDPPAAAITLAGTGTGAIVGEYYGYLRFVDRDGNYSNLSPVSTLYEAKNGTVRTITGASNATPIVITSSAHGLTDGDTVRVEGVGGNTSANVTATITFLTVNTFSLDDSSGTADYTGGGTFTAGVETITYTGLEAAVDPKIARRQVLRNTDGQADVFYVDLDTTDLSSTSLSSTKDDETLSAQESQAILDERGGLLANTRDKPPTDRAVFVHYLDRMYAIGQQDETRGHVKVTLSSTTVYGVATDWVSGLEGRYLYVLGAEQTYEIDSVNVSAQTLTLTEAYLGSTDKFAPYAIRPEPGRRRIVNYTPAGEPESWPPTFGLEIQDTGDEIVGGFAKGSFLYITEKRHIHKLTAQDDPALDGSIFKVADRGAVNNRCHVLVDDQVYLLDEAGIYRFSGHQDVEHLSTSLQDIFRSGATQSRFRINWRRSKYFFASHFRSQTTIRWFVCLSGSFMPRHALCFNYRLERWWIEEYPFPLGAACSGSLSGEPRVYLGGIHKKVFLQWEGTTDVVDTTSGTVRGTVTSSTILSLTDSQAAFPENGTVVNSPVVIVDGTGKGQVRRVVEVDGQILKINRPWMEKPDTTSVYQLGGIKWNYRTTWMRFAPNETSEQRQVEVIFSPTGDPATMDFRIRYDFSDDPVEQGTFRSDEAGWLSRDEETDILIDLEREDGIVTIPMPGGKDRGLPGRRFVQPELGGCPNQDPVSLFQVAVDGIQTQAVVEGN